MGYPHFSADCAEYHGLVRDFGGERPRIICLCGSTRFMDAFHEAGWRETLAGKIVLSVGVAKHVKTPDGGHAAEALGPGVAEALDELHKRKIDLADEILVLNVGGYIGESTRSEVEYAERHGKAVRWLEPRCCLDCATDDELAAATPPFGEGFQP
jgi:hypothetical protein